MKGEILDNCDLKGIFHTTIVNQLEGYAKEFLLGFYTSPKVSVFRLVLYLEMKSKIAVSSRFQKNGKKKTLCDALAVLKQRILRCSSIFHVVSSPKMWPQEC